MSAESFTLLDFAPAGSYLDHDETAPLPFAVWTVGPDADIIGAGQTAEEAIADARKTVEGWAAHARQAEARRRLFYPR